MLLPSAAGRLQPPSWKLLRREAGRTPSPNSGWPMAAMALRLGVCLRKPGVYALNADGTAPSSHDVAQAARAGGRVVAGFALAAVIASAGLAAGAA